MPRQSCNLRRSRFVSWNRTMSNPIKLGLFVFIAAIGAVILFKLLGVVLGIAFNLAVIAAVGLVIWGLVSYGAKALSGRDHHRLP